MKCTSKMCTTYLKLHNQPIPAKLDEKRKAVLQHKDSLSTKSMIINDLKVEPLVRTSYVLVAQLMTSNEENI